MKTKKTKTAKIKALTSGKFIYNTSPDKEKYKISIQLGEVVLKGEGTTALEALQSIPVPNKITTKGILTISQGKKKKELVYTVPKLRRLFYPNAQPIIIKYLASLLK